MRVLLDESLPRQLARHFGVHEAQTVFDRGREGVKSGELLTRAADGFDVFITADQKLQHQQNVPGFDVRVCPPLPSSRTAEIQIR